MAKNKTTETHSSVTDFISVIDDEIKRNNAFELIKIMQNISGFEPKNVEIEHYWFRNLSL